MHLSDWGMYVNRGVFLLICISLAVCSALDENGRIDIRIGRELIVNCTILLLYIAVFVLVNPVHYMRVIRCGIVLVLMTALCSSPDAGNKIRAVFSYFEKIMVAVAVVSVVCWFCLSLLHLMDYPWSGDVYLDWSDSGEIIRRTHFMYIYYETQWFIVGHVARNSAIFTEGPMASFCFVLALLIDLYMGDRDRRTERIIFRTALVAAVITTFTTAGALSLMMLLCLLIYRKIKSTDKIRVSGALKLGIVAVACMAIALMWNKMGTLSGSLRVDDIRAGLQAWLNRPFFGGGFENQTYLNSFYSEWRLDNLGYSNSPVEILANGGLYLAAVYVFAFVKTYCSVLKTRRPDYIAYLLIFTLIFTVTIVSYQYITMFVLCVLTMRRVCDETE